MSHKLRTLANETTHAERKETVRRAPKSAECSRRSCYFRLVFAILLDCRLPASCFLAAFKRTLASASRACNSAIFTRSSSSLSDGCSGLFLAVPSSAIAAPSLEITNAWKGDRLRGGCPADIVHDGFQFLLGSVARFVHRTLLASKGPSTYATWVLLLRRRLEC